MSSHVRANVDRFSGFSDRYNDCRPQPPAIFVDMVTQMAEVDTPALVVDLGCGTGLSTRIWEGRAREVVGIEPNSDMRAQAEAVTCTASIRYRDGLSTDSGLPDGCADIVTVCQALHWMEPEPTFEEVARILKPSGVLAAMDTDWPPMVTWEIDAQWKAVWERSQELQKETGIYDCVKRWPKSEHLDRMRDSGRFRYVSETHAHQVDSGNADRYVGLLLSQGGIASLLKLGVSEEQIGIDRLREVATRKIGDRPIPWYYSYTIRLGIT